MGKLCFSYPGGEKKWCCYTSSAEKIRKWKYESPELVLCASIFVLVLPHLPQSASPSWFSSPLLRLLSFVPSQKQNSAAFPNLSPSLSALINVLTSRRGQDTVEKQTLYPRVCAYNSCTLSVTADMRKYENIHSFRAECVLFPQPHWGTGDIKIHFVSVSSLSLSMTYWCSPVSLFCWVFTLCSHFVLMTCSCPPLCVWLHHYVFSPCYTAGNPKVHQLTAFFSLFSTSNFKDEASLCLRGAPLSKETILSLVMDI